MTQLDPEAWLERTREALSPRDADQARVLAALEKRLQLPPNAANSGQERSNSLEIEPDLGGKANALKKLVPGRLGLPTLDAPSSLLRWTLRALVPLASVAAISVLVTTHSARPTSPSTKRQALKPVAAAVTQASLPDALDLALAQAAEASQTKPAHPDARAPKSDQRPADAAPPEKKPARKKCRAANGSERPCTTGRPAPSALASAVPPAASAPAASAPAASLSKELAVLREAQRALRNGHPAEALEVLTAFERATPGPGAMQEERYAAGTMARCALSVRGNPQSGSELYDAFVRRYPNSAYTARLSRLCMPK